MLPEPEREATLSRLKLKHFARATISTCKALEGKLRIELRSSVTAPAESGDIAIVPGDSEKSGLVARITPDGTITVLSKTA